MAQVISHRYLIVEAQVRFQASPCGSYDKQSGSRIGFSPSIVASPAIIIPAALHIV
jgi:hypothetical protein